MALVSDVDECSSGTHECVSPAECVDADPSSGANYNCVCPFGTLNADGLRCDCALSRQTRLCPRLNPPLPPPPSPKPSFRRFILQQTRAHRRPSRRPPPPSPSTSLPTRIPNTRYVAGLATAAVPSALAATQAAHSPPRSTLLSGCLTALRPRRCPATTPTRLRQARSRPAACRPAAIFRCAYD